MHMHQSSVAECSCRFCYQTGQKTQDLGIDMGETKYILISEGSLNMSVVVNHESEGTCMFY